MVVPPIDWMVPAPPAGLTASAEGRAARPAPPARSAATTTATPRAGRSRRFEEGYDILWSSRGARGMGGIALGLKGIRGGCAAVAGIWHHERNRERPAAHVVWEWTTRGRPSIPAFATLP